MRSLVVLFLLTYTLFAEAEGVGFQVGLGVPSGKIVNPDQSEVFYGGIGLETNLLIPMTSSKSFSSYFTLNGRYLDLNNNANSDAQRESGNHIGLGPGISFRFHRLVLGYEYFFMKMRHYWVGDATNDYTEGNYNASNLFIGMDWSISKMLVVGARYSQATANLPASETGLTDEVPLQTKTYWLTMRLQTDLGFAALMKKLVGAK